MADAKISALTNLTAADPTNDMIPIVDVSDTPPASGNTKRISINNILSSSPTASGALTVTGLVTAGSATITGDLTVRTNKLAVTSTGVGIVTATPRVSLDVASGEIYSSGQITWGGSSPTANQGFLSFTGGNAVVGSAGATALLLYTNGAERCNITSAGNLSITTGNVVMATSGKGIDFSATANGSGTMTSELLNDYEEGTFTPTVSSVGGTGIVYVAGGSDAGKYTKIGNTVRFTVNLSGTYTGTFTYIRITLPFTVGTTTDAVSGYDNGTGLGLAGRTDVASARFIVYIPQSSGSLGIYSGSFNA